MQRRLDYPEKPELATMRKSPINSDSSLAIEPLQNQRAVGRVLTRHVGLKPDLRPNGLSVIKIALIPFALIAAPLGYAEELGRLFFTPQQRAQLEYGQKQNGDSPNNASVLTVNGIVQRHGGERTVWINGVPQPAGKSDEQAPDSLPVAVPGQSKPVKVKVGQKLILDQPAQQKPPASAPKKQPADDD